MREKLHLDFCATRASRRRAANFAELYLNGELWGFYSLVEHVDKTFLAARYGNSGGNLYKAVDGLLGRTDLGLQVVRQRSRRLRQPLRVEDRRLARSVDRPHRGHRLAEQLGGRRDRAAAGRQPRPASIGRSPPTSCCRSLDSYAGSGRNFYVYFNPLTGKMEWIVWDAGMSFGSYWGAAAELRDAEPHLREQHGQPAAGRRRSSPTRRSAQDYLEAFCELFTGYFSTDAAASRRSRRWRRSSGRTSTRIRARCTRTRSSRRTSTTDITVGGHRKPGLKAFIAAREANVAVAARRPGRDLRDHGPGRRGRHQRVRGRQHAHPRPGGRGRGLDRALQQHRRRPRPRRHVHVGRPDDARPSGRSPPAPPSPPTAT